MRSAASGQVTFAVYAARDAAGSDQWNQFLTGLASGVLPPRSPSSPSPAASSRNFGFIEKPRQSSNDRTPAAPHAETRLLLSLDGDAQPLCRMPLPTFAVAVLSGPEGGLTPAEEGAARQSGFEATALGPRVLRADTAPLAVLAWLGLRAW